MSLKAIKPADLFAGPANFLALGAGLGLAPRAPGTFGTLLGIPLLFLMPQSLLGYSVALLVLFAIGVWCCHVCAQALGVHDHPGIVWDEVVGYLITMMAMPRTTWWVLAGFVVFRIFDISKPWPISWIDRQVHGGLGIMLDDVLAGLFSLLVLQILLRLL
ncbi:phosphatidylglycerophosphatase A [Granulosicoccus antarcticus]|uniref:Phosphatidylglycerophosphatase A n=1 Tax=Granulosicoccus antarcticus IMCC3135 TaxID=1192854 RepID=A0A2Z2P3Q4_9GAMM|nr:phosphatidylglycerophosphatase A [Granulosicoccus antarcticus]ASJ74444.1 Phosphatidylglycerophosphatase A [Granulosicoccus antarcticus IMCC3135]